MAQRTASGLLGLHGERMSKVDTAWLRMDSPNNLMLINGVWTLHPGISREALCQRLQERLLAYPRFRQRVLEDAAGASWVEDRHFDLAQHVQTERLQPRPGQTHRHALQERVAELASLPLDPTRPLWQFHLIENHRDEQGREGSALVVRIHHCIADGIALISVTLSLVDGGQAPPQRSVRQKRQSPSQHPQAWIAEALIRPATDLTVKALGRVGNGAARSLAMLQPQQEEPADPSTHPGNGALDLARAAWQVATDAAALALMPDDSPTRLKGRAGTRKKVAWCDPVPLEDVRAIGKAFNCSINDVLLSCVAGAIGQYLRRQGDKVDGLEIRAMVPINLRPLDEAWKLGNRFGLVPLVLPVGVGNPIERLFEVRRRMNALKGSTQPLLAFGMLAVAGLLVKPAQDALLNLFSRKTTAVMTNVPGPKDKLLFCGSQLEQCMFWVPQSGDIGLGVSILTYGGGVQFGVIADTGLCPEPQLIIDEFLPEFERLVVMGLMLPWGRCWF
jgi:WS/DGAT/MGAT family acyltransferase